MPESESSRPEGDISPGYPDALNQIYSGVIVVNPSGIVEFANDAFCELFSISGGRDSIQGKLAGEVLNVFIESYRDPELGLARVKEIVALGQPVRGEEIPIKNGRTFLRDFYPMSFLGVRGGRVWHHTDVTALKQAEERNTRLLEEKRILISELEEKNQRLEGLASTDLLTGLANRRHFDEVAQAEMHRSSRHGQPLSLMMLDIDHFKRVNDTFGHSIGDRVLQQVADCTRGAVRPYDCLARWGGEEFIILMPNTSLASAVILAERIRESIAAMTTDPVGQVTASLGVAEYLPPSTLGPWLDRADQALYRAKKEGRNRVEVAPVHCTQHVATDHPEGSFFKLVWRDTYRCGNLTIDTQHKHLFHLANDLLDAMLSVNPKETASPVLASLLVEMIQHFHDEETILAALGFPKLTEHQQIHANLVTKALELEKSFQAETLSLGTLFQFLGYEVVAQHMLKEDHEFFYLIAES